MGLIDGTCTICTLLLWDDELTWCAPCRERLTHRALPSPSWRESLAGKRWFKGELWHAGQPVLDQDGRRVRRSP